MPTLMRVKYRNRFKKIIHIELQATVAHTRETSDIMAAHCPEAARHLEWCILRKMPAVGGGMAVKMV